MVQYKHNWLVETTCSVQVLILMKLLLQQLDNTIRIVLANAAHYKWNVYKFDVKSTFLNGVLNKKVSVEQPIGYEVKGEENKVYQLKEVLYGFKQGLKA